MRKAKWISKNFPSKLIFYFCFPWTFQILSPLGQEVDLVSSRYLQFDMRWKFSMYTIQIHFEKYEQILLIILARWLGDKVLFCSHCEGFTQYHKYRCAKYQSFWRAFLVYHGYENNKLVGSEPSPAHGTRILHGCQLTSLLLNL